MMGDSGGGMEAGHVGNEDSSAAHSCGEHYSASHSGPPFLTPGSMDRPPPERSSPSLPPTMSPSLWPGRLTPSFMGPGMSPAWPGGVGFASVGPGGEGCASPGCPEPDRKVYDGQGRNILQVPSYNSVRSNEGSAPGDGSPHRESFSTKRDRDQPDVDDITGVSKNAEHSSAEEGTDKCLPCSSSKEEKPSSPSAANLSQAFFSQTEARKVYSTDTGSPCPEMDNASSYTVSSAAAKMNPDMLNVPFSSKAFVSHLTEFSKTHGHFITSPRPPPHNAQNDRPDSAQPRTSPFPEDSQSSVRTVEGGTDHQTGAVSELTEKPEEPSSSQAEVCPLQDIQPPSSPSCNKSPASAAQSQSEPAAQDQLTSAVSFFVTPSVYSDSDTDEYTEADYKPIIEKLAANNRQNSPSGNKKKSIPKKRTRVVRKGVKTRAVKEEPESEPSSGSDYQPSPHDKSIAAREKTPERIQPVRRKRRSVPSSFVEYYEDSDDSLPGKSTKKTAGKLKKLTSKSSENLSESKTKKSSKSTAAKPRTKGASKKPNNRTCPECNKTFSRADSLTVHMRVHTGDRPFRCQECGATYKVSSHLSNHVRSKHSNVKAYKCDNCGKAFSTSNAKRRHEKTCGTDKSDRVKHQCSRCLKRFVTEEGFERHKSQDSCSIEMSVDVGDDDDDDDDDDDQQVDTAGEVTAKEEGKTFKCTACPKAFLEFSGLDTHQQFLCGKAPGVGPYTCSQCNKEFLRWNRFVAHCRRHTGDKPYVCSHCGSRFFDKDSLRKHVSRHKGKNNIKCSLCDKQFTVKRTLAMHIMRVHCGMKPYKCNECDGDFASAKLLSTHIRRIHRKEKRFKCQICGRAFFESQAWMKHMILHAGDRPPRIRGPVHKYPCNLCGKSLNMRLMRMHVEEDHPGVALSEAVTKTMVTCQLCKKEFSDPSSLKMHMIRHSGRKDFKCDKCDMYFITPAAMQLHQRKHSDDRPYACDECKQTFRWRASLRDHKMHLHNPNLDPPDANGRRFGCKECGQRFKRYNTLRSHMIRHRGVMPCICSECGKGFTDNTRLKIHMSCHSGSDRPFICETCGAGFYYSFLLKRHIQSRHRPSPWLCNMCGRSLCSKDALKRHIQHHANSPDGKVRIGGNRGKPRKYKDPHEPMEPLNPTESTEPKVKGKRGRKSKKTIEMLKQINDKTCQEVLNDDVNNVMGSNNSSEPREMVKPENVMESRPAVEQTNTVEARSRVEQEMLQSRNSVEPRSMLQPRHAVEPRAEMEARNMMDPRNVLEVRNMMEQRNVMEPRAMMEPRNVMEPTSVMEPRNVMETRNAVEPRNTVDHRNAVECRNTEKSRNTVGARNMMEPRTFLETQSTMEPRTSVEPVARNFVDSIPETSKEPSGTTFLELTRASEMQINSHMYAQQNFGYSPANYMMNPMLWPKSEEH